MPYWHDDIGAHFFQSMTECDTLLLGRKTWQGHAVFESIEEGDPFGDLMGASLVDDAELDVVEWFGDRFNEAPIWHPVDVSPRGEGS